MMSYGMFRLLMYLTMPAQFVVGIFVPNFRFHFAVYVLFKNDYKRCYVTSQSGWETGGWKSDIYKQGNNCFGMRPSTKKEYQKGVVPIPLGNYAAYSSVWQSVFDYYDLMYNRIKSSGQALDAIPTTPFKNAENDGTDQAQIIRGYCNAVSTRLKANGYFTAPLDVYSAGVCVFAVKFKSMSLVYIGCIVLAVLLPVIVAVLVYCYLLAPKGKRGIKRLFKK